MKNKTHVFGHVMAMITILIWGNTFVSTKILITWLSPFEILFFRFLIGYFALIIMYPHFKKPTSIKEELLFLSMGLLGVTVYQLSENFALVYSSASTVGLLVSTSPIFTAAFVFFFNKNEKVPFTYIVGFVVAIAGTALIVLNGMAITINPLGDFLALFSAVLWGAYCMILHKVIATGHHVFYTTRKTFFYGLITMIPFMFFMDFKIDFAILTQPPVIFNLVFLGVGASSIAFATWSKAAGALGSIKSAVYLYLLPFVTIITSAVVLKERVTPLMAVGCVLILIGVYLSDKTTTLREPVAAEASYDQAEE